MTLEPSAATSLLEARAKREARRLLEDWQADPEHLSSELLLTMIAAAWLAGTQAGMVESKEIFDRNMEAIL